MEMSASILISITHTMQRGQPLWALLTANEYMSTEDPIRLALVLKASAVTSVDNIYSNHSDLIRKIFSGHTLSQLSNSEKELILGRERLTKSPTRDIPFVQGTRRYKRAQSNPSLFRSSIRRS